MSISFGGFGGAFFSGFEDAKEADHRLAPNHLKQIYVTFQDASNAHTFGLRDKGRTHGKS